jgi:hypothetical protein
MLHQWIRVLNFNGTALSDVSLANQASDADLQFALTTSSYIYIGKHFPFNNLFFHVKTPNDVESVVSIEYWDGRDWKPTVDLLDATSTAGKAFAKSGVIQFSPNRSHSWMRINDTSDNGGNPVELRTMSIYQCYWVRLKVSANLKVTTVLNTISYAFTTSDQVESMDVTIKEYKASFKTGKTDWIDEIMTASLLVVKDLKRRGLVVSEGDVLRFDDVSMPTDYMTLWLIFSQLGPSFVDRAKAARDMYDSTMSTGRYMFDTKENALVTKQVIEGRTTTLVR